MLTKAKFQHYRGILNNLFARMQAFPVVKIFLEVEPNHSLIINFIDRKANNFTALSPDNAKMLKELMQWYEKELAKHMISAQEIETCDFELLLTKSRLLLIPYNKFTFTLKAKSGQHFYHNTHTVRGWL